MKVTSNIFYGLSIFISVVIAPYYLIIAAACFVLTQPFAEEILTKVAEVAKLTVEELSNNLLIAAIAFVFIFVCTIAHSILCYKASNRNNLPLHIVTLVFGAISGVPTTIVAAILGIVYWALHRGRNQSAAPSEPASENS